MEPLLAAVTALSLLMALAMALLAWRLLREEQRRSDARVAALSARAEADDSPPVNEPSQSVARRPASCAPESRRASSAASPPSARPAPLDRFDLPLRPVGRSSAPSTLAGPPVGRLFEPAAPAGRGWARLAALALAALILAGAAGLLWQFGGRPADGGAAGAAPVELVSLAHDRNGDTLRVAGIVQNPRAGEERRDVVAVVFLFDAAGTLVASGRAPIDFTRLAPGEESPFVVLVPNAGTVARYRLGFRTRDGRVLAHVDRRSDPAAAADAGRPGAALAARTQPGDPGAR